MNTKLNITILFISLLIIGSCKTDNKNPTLINLSETPKDMIWIPGGTFIQGAVESDRYARKDEQPRHNVTVEGFYIDITEVTNAQFSKFIKESGYVTVAERAVDWEELKKQLPAHVEKPHDSILQPGSLSFHCKQNKVTDLNDYSQWWQWKTGANWRHPEGKGSTLEGKENHPVVHVSYEDVIAYCKWAGRRLPTEAEWEYAARAGQKDVIFTWGNDTSVINSNANTWQGVFPTSNTKEDGFERSSPVKSYPPNKYGLYDMAGNVWEWTQDWYDYEYYSLLSKNDINKNPKGPKNTNNPNNPYAQEKVIKGGSFLCHDSYCASYRVSARMYTSFDTGLEHLGFRTVTTSKMLANK